MVFSIYMYEWTEYTKNDWGEGVSSGDKSSEVWASWDEDEEYEYIRGREYTYTNRNMLYEVVGE